MSSKVYFIKLKDGANPNLQAAAVQYLYDACQVGNIIAPNSFVAIKIHVGDRNNTTHIAPEIAAAIVKKVKEKNCYPFLTETATLYKGVRSNAVLHTMHAVQQGFTIDRIGAPFILADGLSGDSEIEVEINSELNRKVSVAREARMADSLIILSHPTGHLATGYAGAIKNLGMGLSSRKGKLRQHFTVAPEIVKSKCVLCGRCIKWCPEDAISEVDGKAYINSDICIGCGECLAVCQFDAVKFNFGMESSILQKQMAEHALGVVKGKESNCFYFNIAMNMTMECDCMPVNQKKIIPDVGILASSDPVAIDSATLDLTRQEDNLNLNQKSYGYINGRIQLEHAQKIGMGTMNYELVECNVELRVMN